MKALLDGALLVRRHFANWPYIISMYARGKAPQKFVLKDGRVLDFTATPKRFEFANFARLLDAGWHVDGFDDVHMKLTNHLTLKIRYREPPDIFSMREVFLDQVYSCDCKGKAVLDVGMFNGDSSVFFASRGASKVFGFEPFPDSFGLAIENIRLNGMENTIEASNAAIDTASGTGRLSIRKGEVNFCGLDSQSRDTIEVATVGLDDEIKRHAIEIVKMDCEGCEYSVLKALSEESLSIVSEFILEFHHGAAEISERLRDGGFKVAFEDKQVGILRAKR